MHTSPLVSHQSLGLDRRRLVFRTTFAACVISALILIWGHRFLPISDYPDWVFEGSIVAELIHGKAPASYSFKHYPVPYSGTVAMLGVLDLALPPEISGKIVLCLCVVLFALSSTYLLTSLSDASDNPLILIPLLFLLNTYFFWGELAYLFALSFFFFYSGYLIRRICRSKPINWWLVGAASIIMFFFHFLPYATAILVTLVLMFAESRTELLSPFLISFAPSIGLTIWYAFNRVSMRRIGPAWTFWTPHLLGGRWLAAFSLFPEFLPWLGIQAPSMKVFAFLNLVVTMALTLVVPLCVLSWVKLRPRYLGVLAATAVCAIAVVASGYEFEGMISPGERFLYPTVWIGLCWLIGVEIPGRVSKFSRALTVGITALLVCQIAFMQIYVGDVSKDLAALFSKLRSAKSQTELCTTYETYLSQSWDQPRRTGLDVLLTNHASAPRLLYYLYVERKIEAPIFQIGILDYSGAGDSEDLCKSH